MESDGSKSGCHAQMVHQHNKNNESYTLTTVLFQKANVKSVHIR